MVDEPGNEVQRFYDVAAERELARLTVHRVEHAITWRVLQHHLPPPPGALADVGGGPGRYAVELSAAGYDVTLVDLSAGVLRLADELAATADVTLARSVHANALDLSVLPGDFFDAVLLLGPLYHLLSVDERRQCLAEARRLLRDGGFLFAAFITRYSPLRNMARRAPMALMNETDLVRRVLTTGQHRSSGADRFTDAYFAHPTEIAPLLESSGFGVLDLIACEGIVSGIEEQLNALEGDAWEAWVALNYQVARDPSILGAADHLLCVGRKIH